MPKTKESKVNLIKHPQYVKIFEDTGYGEDFQPLFFFSSTCCAAGILSAKQYHSLEQIQESINYIRKTSYERNFKPEDRTAGEKCILCVISPGEDDLRVNIKKLKFQKIWTFNRRNGYAPGKLELWALNL